MTELRGYCIPFGVACTVGTMLEYADRDSFAEIVACRARPFLTFRVHDSEPIGQIDELFIDDYGLGFRATIDELVWNHVRWQMCRRDQRDAVSYCSVFMAGLQHERVAGDGRIYHRIRKADIQHVAITDSSCVYPDTGCWPAKVTGAMPPRVARLAERWEAGYAAHREAAEGAARAKALAATRARLAAKASSDRAAALEAFRERIAASIALGRSRPMILGHAAFSKAGGYDDAKFARQIQAYRTQPRPMVW